MTRLFVCLALFGALLSPAAGARPEEKTSALKGTVYRGDKEHPAAGAEVILLGEKKSGGESKSVATKTDERGNYAFESVAGGKYTVSIRTWHDTQEKVPCQLLAAKTADKDSAVIVMQEKGKYVEQVFISKFSVKGGKEMVRDFDIACKGLFEK